MVLAGRRERALRGVQRHLEVAAERCEGSSQLVGCGRDELVLEAVELEEAVVLPGELCGRVGEPDGLLLKQGVSLASLFDQALHHETCDRGDRGEDKGAPPAGR